MKLEIDNRPQTSQNRAFFAIRLFPENNEEMAKLEWGSRLFKVKCFETLVVGDTLSYVVQFEDPAVRGYTTQSSVKPSSCVVCEGLRG